MRLRIDGAETPITFFSEIDEKKRSVSGEVVTGGGDAEPAAEPVWRSRDILVFLDETTMVEARRDLVVRSLARQLDQLTAPPRRRRGPADRRHGPRRSVRRSPLGRGAAGAAGN